MAPKDDSPKSVAAYLLRTNARIVIGVLRTLRATEGEWFRGKVNLGVEGGARGRNYCATLPVETVVRLGLAREERDGATYLYLLSAKGLAVLTEIEKEE